MPFPDKVKEDALVACGRHCCLCHLYSGHKMEVHHVKQESDGGSNTYENAIPLCLNCHAEVKAYDPHHPVGNKFTESELIRHRDIWYNKVQNSTALTTNSATMEIDRKTYRKLSEYLPRNLMRLIHDIDFAGWSFKYRELDKVEFFPELIEDPIYEYLDADLEAIKVSLAERIKKFSSDSIPYLHSDDGILVMIPRDWEITMPEKYDKAAEILNKDTWDIWEIYCDYIKLCRRKLQIDE